MSRHEGLKDDGLDTWLYKDDEVLNRLFADAGLVSLEGVDGSFGVVSEDKLGELLKEGVMWVGGRHLFESEGEMGRMLADRLRVKLGWLYEDDELEEKLDGLLAGTGFDS